MKRLKILTLALLLTGALAAPALAAPDDMTLGKADAKVTVIEYASTTCPHCARWSEEVFPEFKKKYVDTGKVRYVLRELPTPPEELAAAGFLVARCAGGKYFEVVDDLWRDQAQLFKDRDAKGWLLRAGAKVGMDEAKVAGCVNDQAQQQAFEAREDANLKDKQVSGTPAIFVGSVKVGEGEIEFDKLSAEIDKQLKAAPAKPAAKPKRKKR
ncbi:MAG: DsbA family protein [Proteobacteria bacterium]|nr:DsbA family protein [Pseudomonadota bacterium]